MLIESFEAPIGILDQLGFPQLASPPSRVQEVDDQISITSIEV